MPCYKPLDAWITGPNHHKGPGQVTFTERGDLLRELTLPCGRCRGCRLEHSRQWAIRCMHEAQMHKHNCFITLTYHDEHLPQRYRWGTDERTGNPLYSGTLDKTHIQKFIKRMRKALGKGEGLYLHHEKIQAQVGRAVMGLRPMPRFKYYYAGEYGERNKRPHYHLCIFGVDLADKRYLRTTPAGSRLYRSAELERLWPFGFSTIGALTFESAAYTARYVMKKVNGEKQKQHYEKLDIETGEILNIYPEYNDMSRRPAIARQWLETYTADVYTRDHVIIRGKENKPPRYYDKLLSSWDPDRYELIQLERHTRARQHAGDNTTERLKVREQVLAAKLKFLKRDL